MSLPALVRRSLLACLLLLPALSQAVTTYKLTDTTTQGQWIGIYGTQGFILNDYNRVPTNSGSSGVPNDPANPAFDAGFLPSYLSGYSYDANAADFVWQSNVTGPRALQDPNNPSGPRNAATVFGARNGAFTMTFDVSQAQQFQLAVYALDWDGNNARSETISVEGASVGVSSYSGGHWVVFEVNAAVGPLAINVVNEAGFNAVISAVAFDAVPEPSSAMLLSLGVLGLTGARRRR